MPCGGGGGDVTGLPSRAGAGSGASGRSVGWHTAIAEAGSPLACSRFMSGLRGPAVAAGNGKPCS